MLLSTCRRNSGLILSSAVLAFTYLLSLDNARAQQANGGATTAPLITTYTNPLAITIADPFVLKEGDTYYMYGTNDNAPGRGFDVYKSTNLVNWQRVGKVYNPTRDSFGTHSFWAPEVIKKDGAFYLHYTSYSNTEGRRNICVAKADSPEGPFEDYAGPLFPGSVIDSHIYHYPETDEYFVYASPENTPPSRILGARLSDDFKSLETSPTTCLTAEFGWEDLWIEGPIIHEHNATLYMLYSGGAWWEAEYALGYATAKSPLGPWTKHGEPVLTKSDEVMGAGHNGLTWSPDGSELMLIYHAHASDATLRRVAAMDRIVFEKATTGPDALTIPGAPSSTPQPLPSGTPPLPVAQSDDFSGDTLNDHWHVYMNFPDEWKVEDGKLKITSIDGDFWRSHKDGHNIFLQPIPDGDFAIETKVDMPSERTNEQAFLTLFTDEDNHVTLAGVYLDGPRFAITQEVEGKPDTSLALNDIGWPVHLRIEKTGDVLKCFASADGEKWQPVPRDVKLRNWSPRFIGVGAWSPGEDRNVEAAFDYFKVEAR